MTVAFRKSPPLAPSSPYSLHGSQPFSPSTAATPPPGRSSLPRLSLSHVKAPILSSQRWILMATILLLAVVQIFYSLQQHSYSYPYESNNNRNCAQFVDQPAPPPIISQQQLPLPQNARRSSSNPKCAINLYGLPRSFQSHVLPSLVENVIKPNLHYGCDYFAHFFNLTKEQSGRSGKGGDIDPSEVFLLKEAIHNLYNETKEQQQQQPPPRVEFISDTNEDFYMQRNATIHKIQHYTEIHNNNNVTQNNPYYPTDKTAAAFDATSTLNILKMWHSQTRVFELMESYNNMGMAGNEEVDSQQHSTAEQSSPPPQIQPHYSRVAMLRLDVIYMTPIDIYKVANDPTPQQYGLRNEEKGSFWKHGLAAPIDRSDYYFYDFQNNHAVIPGFASFPVNDRMIMGPFAAVQMWSTQRWKWMDYYVHNILQQRPALRKFGLHDERFLAYVVIPKIRKELGIRIMVDRNLYFFRVRADGSIWILDCPFSDARFKEPKKLEFLLKRKCLPVQHSSNPVAPYYVQCPPAVVVDTSDGGEVMNATDAMNATNVTTTTLETPTKQVAMKKKRKKR